MIDEIIIALILVFTALNYAVLILTFKTGLKRSKSNSLHTTGKLNKVSVIISARNEAENITGCIQSLHLQDYPSEMFEVLIVDDQSTDNSINVVKDALTKYPVNCRILETTGKGGKKQAVYSAIKESTGDLILTTDADCELPRSWIRLMSNHFSETEALFIAGPVMMKYSNGLFQSFQSLEFNSLMAATAGSFGMNMPVMSNGANMGFSAGIVQQGMLEDKVTSGEDVFTMFSIKRRFGSKRLTFLNDPDAVVYTRGQSTLRNFMQQRIRWTSKSSHYRDRAVIYTAVTVLAFNLAILSGFIYSLTGGNTLTGIATVTVFIVKCTVDFLLLGSFSKIYGQKELLKYLIPFEPIVIVYTSFTGIFGNFLSYQWKGRSFKR